MDDGLMPLYFFLCLRLPTCVKIFELVLISVVVSQPKKARTQHQVRGVYSSPAFHCPMLLLTIQSSKHWHIGILQSKIKHQCLKD